MDRDEKLEKDAISEGFFTRDTRTSRIIITQHALRTYVEHQRKLEKMMKELDYALYSGGDVEIGVLDSGVFIESATKPNWRAEFIALGGDPKTVLERTLKKEYYRTRVFLSVRPPKGKRVAPTMGEPLEVKKEDKEEETENGQD